MTKRKAILAVAATAVATAGLLGGLAASGADSSSSPMFGDGPGAMMAHFRDGKGRHDMMGRLCSPRRDAMLAAGIAYVGASLTFTPEQTTAWDNLTATLREGSTKVGENCAARAAQDRPATSTDRLARMEEGLSSALSVVQDIRPAYDAFYATLTAEQKETLEDLLPHGRFGGREDRGGPRHHHGERHGGFNGPAHAEGGNG